MSYNNIYFNERVYVYYKGVLSLDKRITSKVFIDEKSFRRFAVFENLYKKHTWIYLILFFILMTTLSIVYFLIQNSVNHSTFLAYVIIFIAITFPLIYLALLLNIIKTETAKLNIKENPKYLYTIELLNKDDGIKFQTEDNGKLVMSWSQIRKAYRVSNDIYLYFSSKQVFILPENQLKENSDTAWEIVTEMLPPKSSHTYNKPLKFL